MKLDLEAIQQAATAADNGEVLALVELARRQERELTAARAEQGKPFAYVTPGTAELLASGEWAGKKSIAMHPKMTEGFTKPLFFGPAQAAPVVAASELSDELPALPEPHFVRLDWANGETPMFAAEQMRDYARAVLAAATPAASVQQRFEAWAEANGFYTKKRNDIASDDEYFSYETEQRWRVWQAASGPVSPAVQQPAEGGTPRERFEAWAKLSATPYDLREHKFIANGVRTFMQDRTQWAFEAYCGALGLSFLPAAPTQAEG